MKQKHARNSSLELLRIICILLIIGHHYCAHGGYAPFSAGTLSPGAVFVQSLGMFGRLSCSVFILITGFCMAEHTAEGHYKRIVPVAAEMIFYSVVIWLGFVLLGGRPLTVTEALNAFVPFFHGNWFLVYYLVFYPFIPFVNLFIHAMSKEVYRRLLLVVYVIWCLAPTFTVNAWVFSNVDLFLVMYLTGAYSSSTCMGKRHITTGGIWRSRCCPRWFWSCRPVRWMPSGRGCTMTRLSPMRGISGKSICCRRS